MRDLSIEYMESMCRCSAGENKKTDNMILYSVLNKILGKKQMDKTIKSFREELKRRNG